MPWIAICFAFGIGIYFAVDQEPQVWAAALALATAVSGATLARQRPFAFPVTVALAAIAAGFATATIKRAIVAHPVLSAPLWNAEIAGFIEIREERERSDRITVRVARMGGARLPQPLERVRVAVRKGTAPPVGSFVEFKGRLSPPLEPLRPGGYDFARDIYFQRIAATGFVTGRIHVADTTERAGFWLRYATFVDQLRGMIDSRIRAVLNGDKGAIASALITGKRDAISGSVNEAMYMSGLGHILSISGYHMAVVVAIVFFAIRASLALVPAFTRHPIKKWAAIVALAIAAFYLLLSGGEVATQRSFIMVALVLIGVMIDRATLTFRTLTVAALVVLLLAPEALVHPSFQMSFAATLALVAGYQGSMPWMTAGADTPVGARIALWGGSWVIGSLLVSLLAGTATLPYAAYHFHRLAPYGVLANLLAMPIVSVVVMPLGIAGVLVMPLGLDASCWFMMGQGVEWMMAVAIWVAGLPGAMGRMAAFGTAPLLLCSFGLVLLCLLKTPLRLVGAVLIAASVLAMVRVPQPDILVAADASMVAVRGTDSRLSVIKSSTDGFALREWLAADADARTPKDATLGRGTRCDDVGCVGKLRDGSIIAFARSVEALAEDCRRAAVIVTAHAVPPGCSAMVIDRNVWRRSGAMALRRLDGGFEVTAVRRTHYDRPWAPANRNLQAEHPSRPPAAGPPLDATPHEVDLEPGDR